MRVDVVPDPAAHAAAVAAGMIRAAVGRAGPRGVVSVAFSGGSTPAAMLAHLGRADLPWDRIAVFQVDERAAPAGSDDRNLTALRRALPHADIAAMPVDGGDRPGGNLRGGDGDGAADLDDAARRYAARLGGRALDLVHLGLGDDGHTASLVPGDPVLDVDDCDVAATGVYRGHRRLTLTFPALARARAVLWLVTGGAKAAILARLVAGDPALPATRVPRSAAVVVADADAAGRLGVRPPGGLDR